MTWNANKVHGDSAPGEHLSLSMDFYQLTTSVNILPGSFGDTNQIALDALVEIISLNGQPILMSTPYSDGNGHYIFKFAIEHAGSWTTESVGPQGPTLVQAIQNNTPAAMGFAADGSLAVTIASAF